MTIDTFMTHLLENPKTRNSHKIKVHNRTSVHTRTRISFEWTQIFYPPEPKCITKNKTQKNQINLAKEPNLVPERRSGQPCCT